MPSFPAHKMAAPFPWYGGKVMQSDAVWARFGAVSNYVEPFAGSLGVLLNRPLPFKGVETVNDLHGHLVNFWRAVKFSPDALVDALDYPATSLDLWARHDVLIKLDHGESLRADPAWHDVESAAWWCWGLCLWIGSGWCEAPAGKRIHTANAGRGIHRATPAQRIHTADVGRGAGMDATHQRKVIAGWIESLSERLRRVRVLYGDWSQAVQSGVLRYGKVAAVYLDPPYAHSVGRHEGLYAEESATVSDDVRAWCLANGDKPRLRIALAGYEGEHDELEAHGWTVEAWKPHGKGYATQSKEGSQGRRNVKRERVWYSPHCLPREPGGALL